MNASFGVRNQAASSNQASVGTKMAECEVVEIVKDASNEAVSKLNKVGIKPKQKSVK